MVAYRNKAFFKRTLATRNTIAGKYPLQTTSNKPVKSIYKKRMPQTKTGMNKSAIYKLARQVKTLQNQRMGETQTHTQWAHLTGANLPANVRPILFGLNNFYDQDIYKGVNNAGIGTYATAGTLQRSKFKSDLNDEYEWNAHRNQDTVSLVAYKPIFTRLNVLCVFNRSNATFTGKVRLTILKVKPYVSSTKLNVTLPAALGGYRNLAAATGEYTNYFDKRYHTIMKDIWLNIKPPATTNATTFTRNIKVDFRYDASVLKPEIDATNNELFWTNTKTQEQIWCLLSTDTENYLTDVTISKFDVWRDQHGANQ